MNLCPSLWPGCKVCVCVCVRARLSMLNLSQISASPSKLVLQVGTLSSIGTFRLDRTGHEDLLAIRNSLVDTIDAIFLLHLRTSEMADTLLHSDAESCCQDGPGTNQNWKPEPSEPFFGHPKPQKLAEMKF